MSHRPQSSSSSGFTAVQALPTQDANELLPRSAAQPLNADRARKNRCAKNALFHPVHVALERHAYTRRSARFIKERFRAESPLFVIGYSLAGQILDRF